VVLPDLRNWAELRGWRVEPDCVYGSYGGYLFTVRDETGDDLYSDCKTFAVFFPEMDADEQQKLQDSFEARKRDMHVEYVELLKRSLTLKVGVPDCYMSDELIDCFLKAAAEILAAAGVPGEEYCAECGEIKETELAFYNDTAAHLCEDCYQKMQMKFDERILAMHKQNEAKNYRSGAAGAMLGGLVGTILWVLAAEFTDFNYVYFGFLIGFAALHGYRLFRGKFDRGTIWIIGATVVFCLAVAELVMLAVIAARFGIPATPRMLIAVLSLPEVAEALVRDMKAGLLAAIFGVAPLSLILRHQLGDDLPQLRKASPTEDLYPPTDGQN